MAVNHSPCLSLPLLHNSSSPITRWNFHHRYWAKQHTLCPSLHFMNHAWNVVTPLKWCACLSVCFCRAPWRRTNNWRPHLCWRVNVTIFCTAWRRPRSVRRSGSCFWNTDSIIYKSFASNQWFWSSLKLTKSHDFNKQLRLRKCCFDTCFQNISKFIDFSLDAIDWLNPLTSVLLISGQFYNVV